MFYTLYQNNSGGVLFENDEVAEYVIVEADNVEEAKCIFSKILRNYRMYCTCCGERWYDDLLDEEDADEEPSIFGEPYIEHLKTRIKSLIIYYKAPKDKLIIKKEN